MAEKVKKPQAYLTDAKITNVPITTFETLNNIAKNEGMTFSGFMKSQLKKIIESYPPNMRVAE